MKQTEVRATPTYGSTSTEYCVSCGRPTTWSWCGSRNGDRPRIDFWICRTCGRQRMQMADVTDAENLCKVVLERRLDALGRPLDSDPEGYKDALQLVQAELLDLYAAWDPNRGRFTGYATSLLKLRVNNYWRQELGKTPKAHVGAASLDDEESELAGVVAARESDSQVDRGTDLHVALAQGGRVLARAEPDADPHRGRLRNGAGASEPGHRRLGERADA